MDSILGTSNLKTLCGLKSTDLISGHSAVRLKHNILVFGSRSQKYIFTYNLYTEEWTEHVDRKWVRDPHSCFGEACAAVLGQDVYMFGGRRFIADEQTNALWKLNKTPAGRFFWTKVEYASKKEVPSPRCRHSGWEYNGNLWIFGGYGPLPNGDKFCNSDVFYFNPSTKDWTNPKCSGQVPPLMGKVALTVKQNKVWLYGGQLASRSVFGGIDADFYELDMQLLTWTVIKTDQQEPQGRFYCSLTATTDNKLVLHGGEREIGNAFGKRKTLGDTWIFDLESQSWRQHTLGSDRPRIFHTALLGLDDSVIIIGGLSDRNSPERTICSIAVTPGPNSLQKQAVQTIYRHKADVEWKSLSEKLIDLLGIDENKEDKNFDVTKTPDSKAKQPKQKRQGKKVGGKKKIPIMK